MSFLKYRNWYLSKQDEAKRIQEPALNTKSIQQFAQALTKKSPSPQPKNAQNLKELKMTNVCIRKSESHRHLDCENTELIIYRLRRSSESIRTRSKGNHPCNSHTTSLTKPHHTEIKATQHTLIRTEGPLAFHPSPHTNNRKWVTLLPHQTSNTYTEKSLKILQR